jgi:Outer membrane protein beta-barrel domain
MKKYILILSILLVAVFRPFSTIAQGDLYYFQEAKTWEFGPRIGFTTSMINSKGDPNIQRGIKMGIVGGVFVRYQLADQWALHTDISYSTRGNKNDALNIQNGYIDISIVPVRNWNYRMFNGDHTFDFFLGPGISLLTTSQDKSGNISDLKSQISSTEFNVVIGGALPFGPFLLTATNRLGMTNLLGSPSANASWNGFVTEWSIAYRFK